MHPIRHFKTINQHRRLVMQYCFRLGLYKQGLLHDLSKYSPAEFIIGAKYYSEGHSPAAAERKAAGTATGWLHHKGRNRHHPEHWVDYLIDADGNVGFGPGRMPPRYLAEMFCDTLAASRIYLKDRYTDSSPYERFIKEKGYKVMHHNDAAEFEAMLLRLKEEGEESAFRYVRYYLRKKR